MMRLWQLSFALLVCLALAGCSKQFMCHLNGTSCPVSNAPQASGGEQAASESSSSSEESAPAEESKPQSSSEQASSAPARDCLPAGAKVKESDYHRCCCDCYRTQVEPVPGMVTCN